MPVLFSLTPQWPIFLFVVALLVCHCDSVQSILREGGACLENPAATRERVQPSVSSISQDLASLWKDPIAAVTKVTTTPSSPLCLEAFQVDLNNNGASFDHARATLRQAFQTQLNTTEGLSQHLFVRMQPRHVQDAIQDMLPWNNPQALETVKSRFPPGTRFVRDSFEEIFVMRPELDYLDEKKIHYDGALKLHSICTIRALVYVDGPTAQFHGLSSDKQFTTHSGTAILFDFNNEMHYASVNYGSNSRYEPRLMVKSMIHIFPPETSPVWEFLSIAAHRFIFFFIKSVRASIEATAGADGSSFGVMMLLDNIMRALNKIHMALPLLLLAPLVLAVVAAPLLYPMQFAFYLMQICAVCTRSMPPVVVGCLSMSLMAVMARQVSRLSNNIPTRNLSAPTGLVGSVSLGIGVILLACAFWALGWRNTFYGREYDLLPPNDTSTNMGWPYTQVTHPMGVGMTLIWLGCFVGYRLPLHLMFMHIAWTWLTAFAELNADTAYRILLAPRGVEL